MIKPMVRNNLCLNSHPEGCAAVVRRQIAYVKKRFPGEKEEKREGVPKVALVLGCSTGYGLASRIAAAFGYGAVTVGVSFEKPATANKSGTPGFYNNRTFEEEAAQAGLSAYTVDGDAFSDAVKTQTIEAIKAAADGVDALIDLVVYSLASPVRTDPKTGVLYRSVIKPIGQAYSGKTLDMMSGKLFTASAAAANEDEIAATVKVMGGEDWELWMAALDAAGLLSPTCRTVAYTYLGPELSWAIYKNGTIGRAKEDLERAARSINARWPGSARRAWVSVNKALVTRASAVIPIIPFYVSCLFKTMKEKGLHEGCIEQIVRLYRERLYTSSTASNGDAVAVDSAGRIRLDDWEMRDDVQRATLALMDTVTEENAFTATDIAGFKHDFLEAHGFDVAGVDYGVPDAKKEHYGQ
jgi:enoyl-[acyl-carrier protein] reductase/trans-2-enoyl-CoA reductase (NAD+)